MNTNSRILQPDSRRTRHCLYQFAVLLLMFGVLFGSALQVQAQEGRALLLDGVNDFARASGTVFPNSSVLQSFTVEAWIYPTATGTVVIATDDAYDLLMVFDGAAGNGGLGVRFVLYNSSGGTQGITEFRDIQLNRWNHVAGIFDVSSHHMTIAINGILSSSPTVFGGSAFSTSAGFMFTVGSFGTANFFKGYVDELRVSSTARYFTSFTPPTSFTTDGSTRGLWRFSEAAGSTTFADFSGSGHTLTAFNGAQTSDPPAPVQLVVGPLTLNVPEGGSSNFGVSLSAPPGGNITVNTTIVGGDFNLYVSAGATLTFTPGNWFVPQAVTISASEDADAANGVASFVVNSSGLAGKFVTATEVDNDTQSLVVSPLALNVIEGLTNTFTVRLNAQPQGNVTVTTSRTSGDTDIFVSVGGSLTFTTANWNTTRNVILSAAQDADIANGQTIFTVASAGLTSQTVTATELDNDSLGLVVSTPTLNIPENGTNSFTVKLNAQPAGDVIVSTTKTSGDSDLTVSAGGTLTFTTGNWDVTQSVTLSAAGDADLADDMATFTVSSSGLASQTVTATEVDNDVIYVDKVLNSPNPDGSQSAPFVSVTDAVNAAVNGNTIRIFGTNYLETFVNAGVIQKILFVERWEKPQSGTVFIGQ